MGASEPLIWAWSNGTLLPAWVVRISVFDQGLTIGLGAFETLVACEGEPFAFSRHWDRLVVSCRGLGLLLPDREAIAHAVRRVVALNGHQDGRVRITVTPGPGPLGSGRDSMPTPTHLVVSAPRPQWPAASTVHVLPYPRNDQSPLAGLKSTSYAENSLGLAAARAQGADEALFQNLAGNLCEGTGSNVFVVRDGTLTTPPLSDGCLPGITRALVLELARELGMPVDECSMPLDAIRTASEAFLTSTTRDIQPIARVDQTMIAAAPGPVTRLLQEAWKARYPRPHFDP